MFSHPRVVMIFSSADSIFSSHRFIFPSVAIMFLLASIMISSRFLNDLIDEYHIDVNIVEVVLNRLQTFSLASNILIGFKHVFIGRHHFLTDIHKVLIGPNHILIALIHFSSSHIKFLSVV